MDAALVKHIARWAGIVALCGCMFSLSIQVLALAGVHISLHLMKYLFIGLFPIFFLAVAGQEYLLSEFTFRNSQIGTQNPKVYLEGWRRGFAGNVLRKRMEARSPKWLPPAVKVLAANAAVQFAILMFQSSDDLTILRGLSAFAAAGYSYAAMLLLAFPKFDHPLPPGDFV